MRYRATFTIDFLTQATLTPAQVDAFRVQA